MIVLQAQKISKSYADRTIFQEVQFTVRSRDRLGIIGPNGCGKTTLLQCISGETRPDQGEVMAGRNTTLGYLKQMPFYAEGTSVWDIVMEAFTALIEQRKKMNRLEDKISRGGPELQKYLDQYSRITEQYERDGGYACENKARRILAGLGFHTDDAQLAYGTLSGGQKTRLHLARLLSTEPDILLLDEPTNHLDINSREWLEEYLLHYSGAVLLVSHDRRFLERLCTGIAEIKNRRLFVYQGDYSSFLKYKAQQELSWSRAYEKQQEYIKRTEAFIRKYKAGVKSRQARGRQSIINRLDRMDKPVSDPRYNEWSIGVEKDSGQNVLQLQNIRQAFAGRVLFEGLDLKVTKGEKIAFIGPNGAGKTTLVRIMLGMITPEQGEVHYGSQVKTAYFSQEYEDLDPEKTLLEEIMAEHGVDDIERARTLLGRMLFTGDQVLKKVKHLSGGEKSRLQLLKIIVSGANFLILDEPSNYLDLDSVMVLEDMLQQYPGTMLLVSHDRYFIDNLAERIVCLENGKLTSHPGNYSYYREKLQSARTDRPEPAELEKKKSPGWKTRNPEQEQEKRIKKMHRELEQIEEDIEKMEQEKNRLEQQLLADSSDPGKRELLERYSRDLDLVTEKLHLSYRDWEERAGVLSSRENRQDQR